MSKWMECISEVSIALTAVVFHCRNKSVKIISRVSWPRGFGLSHSSLFVPLRLHKFSQHDVRVTRGNNVLHILPEWRNKRKDVPDWWIGPQPGVPVFAHMKMEIRVRWWVARYVIFPLKPQSPTPLSTVGVVYSELSFLRFCSNARSSGLKPTNTFTLFLALSCQRKVG